MKIALGCDHGGLSLKAEVVKLLLELGHVVADQGCHSDESVDYPDFARAVCAQVQNGSCERGILICGTGVGMSMAANRFEGIRAGLGNELFTARMSREHNDANVLCLGARVIGPGLAGEIVRSWVSTEFAGGRHQRRIDMF
ncbi:MAG TPA: ribose 5-phosphate isomerase B [Desulfobulbaceae bacterium]|nr:MAG: ribose 5-phosphate isomerase B [Deltaproteobacteria bacterium RIFOXYD12_FULL_53_23]HCC55448.1 ribose 5-phosphate isomerase B [Desulfobulbaceae bacterium]